MNQTDLENEIDLMEIFWLLYQNLMKIIAGFIIGALLALAYTQFLVTPLYQASAKMYIVSGKSAVNISDLQISSQLKSDYKVLLTSREILESVKDKLDLKDTVRQLTSKISITNPADTRIIVATVTDKDPKQAAEIANMLLAQAKQFLPDIMKSEEPKVYEKAIVPETPSSPSKVKNTAVGGLIGIVLVCAVLIIKHLMNDKIVSQDDVKKYLNIQPLAVIPEGNLGSFNKKIKIRKNSRPVKKGKRK